jgi:hypothetical protein
VDTPGHADYAFTGLRSRTLPLLLALAVAAAYSSVVPPAVLGAKISGAVERAAPALMAAAARGEARVARAEGRAPAPAAPPAGVLPAGLAAAPVVSFALLAAGQTSSSFSEERLQPRSSRGPPAFDVAA